MSQLQRWFRVIRTHRIWWFLRKLIIFLETIEKVGRGERYVSLIKYCTGHCIYILYILYIFIYLYYIYLIYFHLIIIYAFPCLQIFYKSIKIRSPSNTSIQMNFFFFFFFIFVSYRSALAVPNATWKEKVQFAKERFLKERDRLFNKRKFPP